MKRKPCEVGEDELVRMTEANLLICLRNQEGFESRELNESLHLQHYGFSEIDNLAPFARLHTLFLNNNAIQAIANLHCLPALTTLNLAYNRIAHLTGLTALTRLYSLDLTHNLIENIQEQEVAPLANLSHLKLAHNKLATYASIRALLTLAKSLTCLDLSNNQDFAYEESFYSQFARVMGLVTVLSLQGTAFTRSVPSYRKETINAAQALLFLDDRPVSEEERALAAAWKQGGLQLEKEVRQRFRQKLQDKHDKIYSEMEERTRVADHKRRQAYDKLTCHEQQQLSHLKEREQHEDFELLSEEEKEAVRLRMEDYGRFLGLMWDHMAQVDVEKVLREGRVEAPAMLIDRETPQAIYVYNVEQEQIPLIREKYYPHDPREIIAVSYSTPEPSWPHHYDALLIDCYSQLRGNLDLLAPTFNLSLYDTLSQSSKPKRFELEQLRARLTTITQQEEQRQRSIDVLYELD